MMETDMVSEKGSELPSTPRSVQKPIEEDLERDFPVPLERPREPRAVLVHNLYAQDATQPEDGSCHSEIDTETEPRVLWTTTVFDTEARDNRSQRYPVAIYRSAAPPDFSTRTNSKGILGASTTQNANNSSTLGSDYVPHWKGCIFEVSHKALAQFPKKVVRQYEGQEGGELVNETERFDKLGIEMVSQGFIVIGSPFLYLRLRDIVGYYPSFYEKDEGDLINLSATQMSEINTQFAIPQPWAVLLHRFPQIEAFVQKGDDLDAPDEDADIVSWKTYQVEKDHTEQLYNFLKPHYHSKVLPCREQLQQPSPSLSFDMLWYVFAPGTDVYVKDGAATQVMVVSSVRSNLDDDHMRDNVIQDKVEYWNLELWYLDSDGFKIGRVLTTVRIKIYDGRAPLLSLDVCPVSVWDASDGGDRRRRIMERSRLLFKSLKEGHLLASYNGSLESSAKYACAHSFTELRGIAHTRSNPPILGIRNTTKSPYKDYDDIYIQKEKDLNEEFWAVDDYDLSSRPIALDQRDRVRPRRQRYSVSRSRDRYARYSPEPPQVGTTESEPTVRESLTEHQLFLLYPTTRAFALKTKQWVTVQADFLAEIPTSRESLENLVLDEAELDAIRALSTRQNSKREAWAADFIEGKGAGQIILLHGPPGVGKTYTVEAIAQYMHRPLLALTVADIGTVETKVELELIKWFSLAESWNAVLLVDEADIFLERRQNRDLARNSLVAAFLRRMEYFKGLLFLTTNRVGQIDDAFISRVHVAIGYQMLSPEHRHKIWQGFFRKLARERAGKIQISPSAKKWVLENALSGKAQLNGRDIRNALQTAITLAEAEYEEDPDFDPDKTVIIVEQEHFKRVLDITNKFQTYVESIRREDEKKRAAARNDRNDYWSGS